MKYWEDFRIGERAELGSHTFSEEEIVAFGREYDPQPFHTDADKAKHSGFGGLIASGWQTCAVGMRLMVEGYISQTVSLGSPGIDNIRWLKPVRPGDILHFRSECIEKTASRSKPDRGVAKFKVTVMNQRDEPVMTVTTIGMYRRKPDDAATG